MGKTKYIIFRPKGAKININLDTNGVLFNSNELGKPNDPSKIFKLGRICNGLPIYSCTSQKNINRILNLKKRPSEQ